MKLKHFKESVVAKDVKLPLIDGLLVVQRALSRFNYELVVTSLSDSVHKDTSLHYRGYAADIRTRDMRVADVPTVVRDLRLALGKDYQVIQEPDHIHLEYDPDGDGGKMLP